VLELTALHPFKGNLHGFDETILVEVHLIDADDTVVSVLGTQRMPVVDDEPLVFFLVVND
jgi:hypothetical protein